jgi:hypothetical protein
MEFGCLQYLMVNIFEYDRLMAQRQTHLASLHNAIVYILHQPQAKVWHAVSMCGTLWV